MVSEGLRKVFQYIDTYQERMIDDLRDACAIRSVSGSYEHNPHIQRMVKWVEMWLQRLKATTSERFDIGSYSVEGKLIKLPTVILASFGKDNKKKTICVYCRYDVKNADASQWTLTDPWKLEAKGGDLYGRGSCKGKMTLLSWFHIIEAFNAQKVPLPVNLKFIIEGMFEMNCFGLEDFLYTQRITFLKNIDFICVNESEWLNSTIPCISYGTCGICQYEVVVSKGGGGGDGENGEGGGGGGDYGGGGGEGEEEEGKEASEAELLMEYIFANCVDSLGNILIPKINDDVVQISPEIEQSLESVECDLTLIKKNLPYYMQTWNKQKILIRMWQMPALISHKSQEVSCTCGGGESGGGGGESGGSGQSALKRKFVLKIVPVQTPDRCNRFVMDHIGNLMRAKFNEPNNKVKVFSCKSLHILQSWPLFHSVFVIIEIIH